MNEGRLVLASVLFLGWVLSFIGSMTGFQWMFWVGAAIVFPSTIAYMVLLWTRKGG